MGSPSCWLASGEVDGALQLAETGRAAGGAPGGSGRHGVSESGVGLGTACTVTGAQTLLFTLQYRLGYCSVHDNYTTDTLSIHYIIGGINKVN